MKPNDRCSALIVLAVTLLIMSSCTGQQGTTEPNSSARPQPKISPASSPNTAKNATIKADPNPIQVCDGSGLGITKLTYAAQGPTQVEVRVSSPNGAQMAHTAPAGTATTGKWVSDGTTFYLQDVSDNNKTLTPDNTLATVTVKLTTAGCP